MAEIDDVANQGGYQMAPINVRFFQMAVEDIRARMDRGFDDINKKLDKVSETGHITTSLVAVHESRIKRLEEENEKLWERLNEMTRFGWSLAIKLIGASAVGGGGVAAAVSLLQ